MSQEFQFNAIHVSPNEDEIKAYVIQSKHKTIINANWNVQNQFIGAFLKKVTCGIPVRVELVSIQMLIPARAKNDFLISQY